MTQPELIWVTDSHVTDPGEQARLSAQSARILARLEQGPATRRELTDIALNVTARISDLRAAGYVVRVIERNRSGRTVYALEAQG